MRFRIRDILLLTTIVAVYTAGAVLVWQAGKLDMSTVLKGMWVQIGMLGWFAYQFLRMSQRVGGVAIKVPRRWRPYVHLVGLLGFWIFVGFSLVFGDEFHFWPVLMLCLVGHVAVEATTNILIGDVGVAWGRTLLLWSEFVFDIEKNALVATPSGSTDGKGLVRFPLMPEDADEVRTILAAKQGEGTTDNTDEHG
jgi:hypothetical protein